MKRAPQAGFSFIEVLIALSILLFGSLYILALFSAGVGMAVQRRLDERAATAQREIEPLVQGIVDETPPGKPPSELKGHPLTVRGYTVDVRFREVLATKTTGPDGSGGGGPVATVPSTIHAIATLRFEGRPVRVLFPIPLTRSTLSPKAITGEASEGG